MDEYEKSRNKARLMIISDPSIENIENYMIAKK